MHAGEVATTASAGKAELCRSLGADIVIDYRREKFENRLRNYDVAFDLLAEPTRTMGILRAQGVRMRLVADSANAYICLPIMPQRCISINGVPTPDLLEHTEKTWPVSWYVSPILSLGTMPKRLVAWAKDIDVRVTATLLLACLLACLHSAPRFTRAGLAVSLRWSQVRRRTAVAHHDMDRRGLDSRRDRSDLQSTKRQAGDRVR